MPITGLKPLKRKVLFIGTEILALPEKAAFPTHLLAEISATARAGIELIGALDGVDEALLENYFNYRTNAISLISKDSYQERALISSEIRLLWINLYDWCKT